MDEIKG